LDPANVVSVSLALEEDAVLAVEGAPVVEEVLAVVDVADLHVVDVVVLL